VVGGFLFFAEVLGLVGLIVNVADIGGDGILEIQERVMELSLTSPRVYLVISGREGVEKE